MYVLLDANVTAGYYLPRSLNSVKAQQRIEILFDSVRSRQADHFFYLPNFCVAEVFSVFMKHSFGTWNKQVKKGTIDTRYTAHPAQARRWEKQGYPVEVQDRDADGNPRGWRCSVPKDAVRFRRVRDGQVVKRRTGGGRQFRAIDRPSERRAVPSKTPATRSGTAGGETCH